MVEPNDLAAFTNQLDIILESSEFRTSPQLREFLTYISQQAFAGRTTIEQVEIADMVLHRSADFNPLEDATVRKLASIVRRKLNLYYANSGAADPVLVTLPPRSYVPQFRYRAPVEPAASTPIFRRPRVWIAGLLAAVAVAGLCWFLLKLRQPEAASFFHLTTLPGNFAGKSTDLPGAGIQLGPRVALYDNVVVRMRFTPRAAHQQAGIMIYQNADRYVAFSRHFRSRPNLDFIHERDGRYLLSEGTVAYDPTGGNDEPIWLAIRRDGERYRAFTSFDGIVWEAFGRELVMPDPMPEARLALFACSGKDQSTPVPAVFDYVGLGLSFHDVEEDFWSRIAASGWQVTTDCEGQAAVRLNGNALEVKLVRREGLGCSWQLTRPTPAGATWRLGTKADFLPGPGAHIALRAGSQARWFNLERTDLDGGSIRADTSTGGVNAPDFPGRPPVFLRIDNNRGRLSGLYSRDGRRYSTVGFHMNLSELGQSHQAGIRAALDPWSKDTPSQTAQFYFIRQEITKLANYK